MRHHLFLYLFLILLYQNFHAQEKKSYTTLTPFVSIGYCSSDLTQVQNIFDDILRYYQFFNIPVTKQNDFGKPIIINVGILTGGLSSIHAGISLSYCSSRAFTSYKDYAGTFKLKGDVSSYQISLLIHFKLRERKYYSLFLRLKPGYAYSTITFNEEVKYYAAPRFNNDPELHAHGGNISIGATFGLTIPISYFRCSFEIGHRYHSIRDPEGSVRTSHPELPTRLTSYLNTQVLALRKSINLTGTVLLFSLGFEL